MERFNESDLEKLYRPSPESSKNENGRVTVIGGSDLFHGAPLYALKTVSRIADMVFFASPEPSVGEVANKIKSELFSFIWIPWEEIGGYIEKSDAVLIGPGFMRYRKEKNPQLKDKAWEQTQEITRKLLLQYPDKRWVIDAGSLQTLDLNLIPRGAVLTPNRKEFEMLFGEADPQEVAKKYDCIVVLKAPVTLICSPSQCWEVTGGNAGLTKGGTGDVQAGLTAALLAKNEPFLAAASASYLIKKTGDALYEKQGIVYNADDLVEKLPEVAGKYLK